MTDPIIDRSPQQKRQHIDKLKAELLEHGFSVVPTEWLKSAIIDLRQIESQRRFGNAQTNDPRSHSRQGSRSPFILS